MPKKKEEKEQKEEPEPKVWKCQKCGKVLQLPPEISDEELKEIEERGELICRGCARAKEQEEREKTVFKGDLTLKRETWKPLLTYAKRLLDEVTFRVNSDTVTIQEMNDDRIAMLKGVIKTESLTEYMEGEKQPDKLFRVDLATFGNAVRQAGYPTTINSDGAFLYFPNSWGKYRMPLLNDGGDIYYGKELPPTPKVKYTVKTKLDIDKIFEKLKWIHEKPKGIRLIAKDGKLSFKAENEVGERVEAIIGECEGEATSVYPLEYLEVLKEQYSSEAWQIEFASELPLHAQKTKRVGERDSVRLDFWLAPRIETD